MGFSETTLDQFFESYKPHKKKKKTQKEDKKIDVGFTAPLTTKKADYLLSVEYDGKNSCAAARFYDPRENSIYFWYDNSEHHPYCFSNIPIDELKKNAKITGHKGFLDVQIAEKKDLLQDRTIKMTKIIAQDPLAIGGKTGAIRELLPAAWEANIPYHKCYIADLELTPGLPYEVNDEKLKNVTTVSEDAKEEINKLFESEPNEVKELLAEDLPLFLSPIPDITRVAIDIEVISPYVDAIPRPEQANFPVGCISVVASDGKKRILLLERKNVERGETHENLEGVSIEYFNEEKELFQEIFQIFNEYPVVLTYNGDKFDMPYLYNRALNHLGFKRNEIPIVLRKDFVALVRNIHVDLYRFFHNRAVQIYAFSAKYKTTDLNTVAKALLGIEKIQVEQPLSKLPLLDLASYCYRDGKITLDLTRYSQNLVWKLIMLLMRISHLPLEDVTRQGVSSWIQNLFYYEHRKKGFLIPRPKDIKEAKGEEASTQAIIKGKKYKGAIVIDPVPGVHFDVVVLDFACFSEDTEILTDDGWHTLARLKNSNCSPKIATVNISSGEIEFQEHQRIFEYDYEGEMYNFSIKGGLDLLVTPNHRMVFNRRTNERKRTVWENKIGMTEAQELSQHSWFRIPSFGKWIGKSENIVVGNNVFSPEEFLPFLGWFLTDGYIMKKGIQISQSKAKNFQHIRDALTHLGFAFKEYEYTRHQKNHRSFEIHDVKFKREFKRWLVKEKGLIEENGSYMKRIPRKILGFEKKHLKLLFDSMILGDGSWNKEKWFSFSSKYKERANDFQELALRLGYGCAIRKEVRDCKIFDYRYKDHVSYHCFLSYTRKNVFNGQHNRIQKKNYFGKVWCVAVPNSTVIVRRNGKPAVTGNSLYPSIIKVHNLSYETVRCPHDECKQNTIPDTNHWVCKQRRGLAGLIIGFLRDIRVKWFKPQAKNKALDKELQELYYVVQQALKLIINAFYGVFGAEHFPLYCLPVAESTTALGRYVITQTIKKAQKMGISVIYGDTDSVFLENPSKSQIEDLKQWCQQTLDIDLDIDKIYRYVALSERKKNYLGVYGSGAVDIKGLTGKKRHTPIFLQNAFFEMMNVLSDVQVQDDFEIARNRIRMIVKTCLDKLKNLEYSLEELAFRVQLTRHLNSYQKTTPQHVKAARLLDRDIEPGSIISFVKVKGDPGVKPIEIASIDEIDSEKYKKHVESIFIQVLDALNVDFGSIIGIRRLDLFM
ncbi:MAG: DNA polymerase domain-containing protein [Promethearchaeota archaeon]